IFALLFLLDRLFFPGLVTASLFGAVVLVSLTVTLFRTLVLGRLDIFQMAMLADQRLDLKERASSALFARDDFEEWGELLAVDAARSLERMDVKKQFPLRFPRSLLWALAPLAASLAIYSWLPPMDLLGIRSRREGESKLRNVVSKELKELDEK